MKLNTRRTGDIQNWRYAGAEDTPAAGGKEKRRFSDGTVYGNGAAHGYGTACGYGR